VLRLILFKGLDIEGLEVSKNIPHLENRLKMSKIGMDED